MKPEAIPSFNITDQSMLADRPYYTESPRHLLILVDGDRRYARTHNINEEAVYEHSQRLVANFFRISLQDLDLNDTTVFLLRPDCFDHQERTDENLDIILRACSKMVNWMSIDESGIDLSQIKFKSITLAGKPWMEAPERVQTTPLLLDRWNELKSSLEHLEKKADNQPKTGRLLINYSGRAEFQALIDGKITSEEIIPPIGLVIRTGDGMRMSDGPAHATHAAHFHLIPKYLPAVTEADISDVVQRYLPPSN